MSKKNLIIIVSIVTIILIMQLTGFLYAQNGWEMNITMKLLNAKNRLTIGQRPDASDAVDGKYDVPALLSGDIKAYMELESNKYWKNIKESCNPPCKKAWNIFVDSEAWGQIIEVSWNSLNIPYDVSIILIDTATGEVIDMKTEQHEYAYENTGRREFIVEVQTW